MGIWIEPMLAKLLYHRNGSIVQYVTFKLFDHNTKMFQLLTQQLPSCFIFHLLGII